jgi:4'-phosphopantetheinyl transferase
LLQFSYNPCGKPSLTEAVAGTDLKFNMSHSHDVALYAVALGREVGIDVEFIRDELASLEVAERFLQHRDVALLRAMPLMARTRAFFDQWTRMEAYIKAQGRSLADPVDDFPPRGSAFEPPQWSLVQLSPGIGYRAALAIQGRLRLVRCWKWS